jgi:hypothetical protein
MNSAGGLSVSQFSGKPGSDWPGSDWPGSDWRRSSNVIPSGEDHIHQDCIAKGWAAKPLSAALFSLLFLLATVLVGCDSPGDDARDALGLELRSRLQLLDQPEGIHSIRTTYDSLQPGQTVTVAGRIYAESLSPFDPNEAAFTIIELPKPGHNHEDPGDCPFCKRELRNAKIAMVKILGADGQVVPYSADQLLGLRKNQDIVVTGTAEQVGDTIIVSMDNFYLLTAEASDALSQAFRDLAQQASSSSPDAS